MRLEPGFLTFQWVGRGKGHEDRSKWPRGGLECVREAETQLQVQPKGMLLGSRTVPPWDGVEGAGHACALEEAPERMDFSGNASLVG